MKHTAILLSALLLTSLVAADSRPQLQQNLIRSNYIRSTETIHEAFLYRLHAYTSIREVEFMGLKVLMHEATREPLRCVTRYIRSHCKERYSAQALSGWRPENTFKKQKDPRRQEYSNHLFGLALDIDPERNPCCQCQKDWPNNPRCKSDNVTQHPDGTVTGEFEMPRCWIEAFKRHGFHWLGDDVLRDTMHFEFLAEPGTVSCAE